MFPDLQAEDRQSFEAALVGFCAVGGVLADTADEVLRARKRGREVRAGCGVEGLATGVGGGEGGAGVVGAEDAQVVRRRHLFGQPDVAVAEHGEGGVGDFIAEVVEGFEVFFYVGFEGVVGCGWVGEGGERAPEEVAVVGLCSEVVEGCVGGTFGEGFVEFADGQGFVGCADYSLVELVAEMGLVG